ncbi:uncharacterized protein SAPINGB_P001569 [Magnusiomyces paraingens]|uniref:Transposase Tc1-like domain-containing protein n=1 Tax=Magnusiomyces paraingens TaxID=2606893 RepID=A0A5E8B711_9ASCO|nr:uncharacterized protein SAPINGB_P001569 [Saprochaete ingens]VVT47153.1 unnamed protein product [Saprochaete ingens]
MTPVTSRIEYSALKRAKIHMKYEMRISQWHIAFEEGVSLGSVSVIIRCYPNQQNTSSFVRKYPFIKTQDHIVAVGLNVSEHTILQWLKHEGIHHQCALRQPLLTPQIAEKRLKFGRMYKDEPESFWKRWILSDESTIAHGDNEKQEWGFCPKSLNKLCEAAVEVWEDFHQDLINKLVLSKPRRLQAVVDANGWYTRY